MNKVESPILIRPATERDQRLIWRSVLGAGLNPLHLHWQNFVLAENGEGEFLGCGQMKPHRDGSLELASIYVIPEERGRGIASAIIGVLLEAQSCSVWLTCRRDLTEFYARFEFIEIHSPERMPAYFRRLKRLMGLFSFVSAENRLAVMCWRIK
ncbi:MAG: GNAT family N-acetyltransferase [Anaerolineales bacterium]|jgi:N-acetylglutamate synthase-like GNAT family acetyltransferase